jgi:16S rRNA processing protein RimM
LVLIGKILRTRGNKGEVVASLSPGAAIPGEGAAVELRSSKRSFPRTIERISVAGSEALIAFSDTGSIGEALKLVGCALWADGPAPEAAARTDDWIGFQVFDLQGDFWGTVTSQPQFSLNQLLEVEDPSSGKTVYVPWHESLVVRLDRRAGTMVIDPPAGLRDLNK